MLYAIHTRVKGDRRDIIDSYIECITDDYEVVKATSRCDDYCDTFHHTLKSTTLVDAIDECKCMGQNVDVYSVLLTILGLIKYNELRLNYLIVEDVNLRAVREIRNSIAVPIDKYGEDEIFVEQLIEGVKISFPISFLDKSTYIDAVLEDYRLYDFLSDKQPKLAVLLTLLVEKFPLQKILHHEET